MSQFAIVSAVVASDRIQHICLWDGSKNVSVLLKPATNTEAHHVIIDNIKVYPNYEVYSYRSHFATIVYAVEIARFIFESKPKGLIL